MKILLAIDDSDSSREAVREVEQHFEPAATTVRILHVLEKFVPPAETLWYDAGGSLEEARRQLSNRFLVLVEDAAALLKARGFSTESVIRTGNAAKMIVNEAHQWGADLVVVGAHRNSILKRILGGTVTKYVVNHAPCPVEIVHRKRDPKRRE